MPPPSPLRLVRNRVYLPWVPIPEGRLVDLPGRGSTYVTDTAGPSPDSPTVVLLHALGCTGLLTWFPVIARLARKHRVVTLDQRWHGQGIRSDDFSLHDCADDVAALVEVLGLDEVVVAGYSMGGVVAQRVWRQHPAIVSGLVLCSTADRFQGSVAERVFFTGMGASMLGLREMSRSRTATRAARVAAGAVDLQPNDIQDWALGEFRSTSPWAIGQALAALGRHHSRPWLSRIDVPTAVVVTTSDRVVPTERQVGLARAIRGATMHEVDSGHAACVLESEKFVPAFLEAVGTVNARRRDFAQRRA
ncbi:alpha/beta fold hydrolase [Nocardioides sp.]|uniref:alpha/beta fold hydrolase n=1 Tax=Nocardioides sp. TaxID=35761 RepID=UPI00271D6D87|nr:alpha/beta hydrolase [Nocardioides sp.]MDO9457814.1 alpha/beta hydrolase [Nocardioides sp.]